MYYWRIGVVLIIILFFGGSCSDERIPSPESVLVSTGNCVVSPQSLGTRTPSAPFDWDHESSIYLTCYDKKVNLPWYISSGNIPSGILLDYKKEDGWELVYNTCNGPLSNSEPRNYLMLYNVFTGVLRVFYYNSDTSQSSNITFWKLDLDKEGNSLLNSSGYFSFPNTIKSIKSAYSTNITNTVSKSIGRGWNVFDMVINYDPTIRGKDVNMSIVAWDVTKQSIKLTGEISLDTKGSILMGSSSPNFWGGLVNSQISALGDGAKNVILDLLKKREKKNKASVGIDSGEYSVKSSQTEIQSFSLVSSFLSQGVKYLVESGLTGIFGSFIGRNSDKTQIEYPLKLTTTGTMNLQGSIESNLTPNVYGVNNLTFPGTSSVESNSIPSYDHLLGSWSLASDPVIVFFDEIRWYFLHFFPTSSEDEDMEKPKITNKGVYKGSRKYFLDEKSIKVLINQDVLNRISSYDLNFQVVRYASLSQIMGNEPIAKKVLSGMYDGPFGWMYKFKIEDSPDGGIVSFRPFFKEIKRIRPTCSQDGKMNYVSVESYPYLEPECNFVVKVTLTLYPKSPYNKTPIVMTRSYLPRYVVKS